MFQLPVIERNCLPYDPTIKIYSWIIVICYIIVIGFLFLIKRSKISREVKSQRAMFLNIALFLFLYDGVRIFFLFSDFERNANCESILYFQYVFIGYCCAVLSFMSLIRFGETYLVRSKSHFLSNLILACVIIDILLIIFLPNIVHYVYLQNGSSWKDTIREVSTLIRFFNYAIQYSSGLIILFLYLYLTVKSTGKLRRNSLITLIGLLIAVIASFLETDALLTAGITPPYLSPILFSIGITIFAFAYLRTMKL